MDHKPNRIKRKLRSKDARKPLNGLKFAYIECKCGYKRKYRTNLHAREFTFTCPNCEAPVDMELSRRDQAYFSLGDYS